MSDTRQAHSGLSLIEVFIAIGIFVLICLAVVDLFISNNTLLRSQGATVDVIGSASALMSDIHTMTLQASHVATSHAFGGVTYTSSTSTLVLELPSINSSGALISGQSDYVVYYASSTYAYRRIDAAVGSARLAGLKEFSNSIVTLTFTYDNASPSLSKSVAIDIQTQKTIKKINVKTHLQEQVYLRNY